MTTLLVLFVILVILAVIFSCMPVLPGPPFAVLGVMLIPFWPDMAARVDSLTWWVSGSLAVLGLLITVIDIASPYLAKLYEGVMGVMLSFLSACFGVAVPVLAALPIPLVLVTPFLGALVGESIHTIDVKETSQERSSRIFRSAFVQWLGLLTTIVLKAGYSLMVLPVGVWLSARAW